VPSFLALDDVWRMFAASDYEAQRRFVAFVHAGRGQVAPSETVVFGSDEFRADVAVALEPHRTVRDFSRCERYAVRPSLECMFAGCHDRASRYKLMADAYWRYGYTLREIGAFLGCHQSTVWKQIRRAESNHDTRSGHDSM
jgi:hypothetical protein